MLANRRIKQVDAEHCQDQIIKKSLITQYIQLIQSYIQKEITNPFIIFTLLCQNNKCHSHSISFFWDINISNPWQKQWLKLSRQLSHSLNNAASVQPEETMALGNFLATIECTTQLNPSSQFAHLLGAFFSLFS